jgi:putative alpha-1,2-mannosidase
MAKKLNLRKDHKTFLKRSKTWDKLYHPNANLILPKDKNGKWLHEDPLSGDGWVESNSWQGTWQVSHDINKLSRLMGGDHVLTRSNRIGSHLYSR